MFSVKALTKNTICAQNRHGNEGSVLANIWGLLFEIVLMSWEKRGDRILEVILQQQPDIEPARRKCDGPKFRYEKFKI